MSLKLEIKRQESYSRGELLLRSFFGAFYIAIPHVFVMMFVAIYTQILSMIAWWVVLFTGKYPMSWFETQVNMLKWTNRLYARLWNLSDGYPAIGLGGTDENTSLEVEYPESLSRGILLLRAFFGIFYVMIPHGIVLYLRMIASQIIIMIAWWIVLFTGSYPESMHSFNVGTIRWMTRLNLYMGFMTDEYPPFSGKE